ncbi:hypothetical protein D9M72_629290 [compost metagenome]
MRQPGSGDLGQIFEKLDDDEGKPEEGGENERTPACGRRSGRTRRQGRLPAAGQKNERIDARKQRVEVRPGGGKRIGLYEADHEKADEQNTEGGKLAPHEHPQQ